MLFKFRLFFAAIGFAFFMLGFSACHRAEQAPQNWSVFTYEEYNGTLYAAHHGETLFLVLCGTFAGIDASLKIKHDCTDEQFLVFQEKVVEAGCVPIGEAASPDTHGFPDLSMYVSFVFSSDELHDLWAQFGLE